MATSQQSRLVIHSRVTAWGFLVALAMAAAFMLSGLRALATSRMLPPRLGIFVEPPEWLIGAMLIAFAAFLFLVGISELARYVKPSTEIVMDADGIAAFGLLGERRFAWRDVIAVDLSPAQAALKIKGRGRMPPPDVRIHFDRLDIDRADILAVLRTHRPDLVAHVVSGIDD